MHFDETTLKKIFDDAQAKQPGISATSVVYQLQPQLSAFFKVNYAAQRVGLTTSTINESQRTTYYTFCRYMWTLTSDGASQRTEKRTRFSWKVRPIVGLAEMELALFDFAGELMPGVVLPIDMVQHRLPGTRVALSRSGQGYIQQELAGEDVVWIYVFRDEAMAAATLAQQVALAKKDGTYANPVQGIARSPASEAQPDATPMLPAHRTVYRRKATKTPHVARMKEYDEKGREIVPKEFRD